MAKKMTEQQERAAVIASLGTFSMTIPTAEEVAKQRIAVEKVEEELRKMELTEEFKKGSYTDKQFQDKYKTLEHEEVLLLTLEYDYFQQGIKPIDKDNNPDIQQMDRIQNKIELLKMENDILFAKTGLTGKDESRGIDSNTEEINHLKRQFHTIEANCYGEKARLEQNDGRIVMKQTADDNYRITLVLNGKIYNGSITTQQHNRIMAVDDRQKMNFISKIFPAAEIKNQNTSIQQKIMETFNDSLYNIHKNDSSNTIIMEQKEWQRQSMTNGQTLAATLYDNISQEQTSEQARSVGMNR